jgi:hypothetical protein
MFVTFLAFMNSALFDLVIKWKKKENNQKIDEEK